MKKNDPSEFPKSIKRNLSDLYSLPVPLGVKQADAIVHPKVERFQIDGGESFRIPPIGFRGNSMTSLVISIIWILIATVFTASTFLDFFNNGLLWWTIALSCIPFFFLAFGIFAAVLALDYGTRRFQITMMEEEFIVELSSAFRRKRTPYKKDEIVSFDILASTFRIEERTVFKLAMRLKTSRQIDFHGLLPNSDFRWLRDRLNNLIEFKKESPIWKRYSAASDKKPFNFVSSPSNRIVVSPKLDPYGLPTGWKIFTFNQGVLRRTVDASILTSLSGVLIFGPWLLAIDNSETIFAFRVAFSFVALFSVITTFNSWIRFEMKVQPDSLEIRRYGLWILGRYRYCWQRKEIESIDVARSGAKGNETEMYRLSIIGKPNLQQLNLGWKPHELSYIAEVLNRTLEFDT